MANVSGRVTDPRNIKDGLVHIPTGGTKNPGYLTLPDQAHICPSIVAIH